MTEKDHGRLPWDGSRDFDSDRHDVEVFGGFALFMVKLPEHFSLLSRLGPSFHTGHSGDFHRKYNLE